MAEAVADGLRAQRHFLVDAASLTGESKVLEMLQPLCRALARVEATKNMAVASKLSIANHCALAAGAMTALLWVTSEDPPRHVRDTLNAVPTYGERLQSQGPTHIEFTAAFTALLRDLGTHFDCFTGTKVQILTQVRHGLRRSAGDCSGLRRSLASLRPALAMRAARTAIA
jgi:hypothetical protein